MVQDTIADIDRDVGRAVSQDPMMGSITYHYVHWPVEMRSMLREVLFSTPSRIHPVTTCIFESAALSFHLFYWVHPFYKASLIWTYTPRVKTRFLSNRSSFLVRVCAEVTDCNSHNYSQMEMRRHPIFCIDQPRFVLPLL